MAFATKYKTSIMNWDGDTITAEIQEDLFADTLEEFSPVGKTAIRIEHQVNVNVKESYIVPSKATVMMYVTDEWDMHDLLYATDRQFKVIIKNGSTEIFLGWVIAGINTEDYTTGQYMIKITAIDGLADLKNIPYLDSGALYAAFQSPLEVIQNCLAETGHLLQLFENIDIYAAAGMTTTTNTHSPLNQSFIHSSAYGETIEGVESCWDVLEHIMQAFHCRVYAFSLATSTIVRWVVSKLDVLGETKTYRLFTAGGAYSTFLSYDPLLTMGSGIGHRGGKAQLSIKQGFKELEMTTDRGTDYSFLKGVNFATNDWTEGPPSVFSINDWGNLVKNKFVATWANIDGFPNDINGNVVAEMTKNAGTISGIVPAFQAGGRVRITDTGHGLATSDWVIISNDMYRGLWKVVQVVDVNNFEIAALYDADQNLQYSVITTLGGMETSDTQPLGEDISLIDSVNQAIKVEGSFYFNSDIALDERAAVIIVTAWKSTSDFLTLDHNGKWQVDNLLSTTGRVPCIIIPIEENSNTLQEFSVVGNLSDLNFYTAGSPKLYISIHTVNGATDRDNISFNNLRVTLVGNADETVTTAINSNYVKPLKVEFFHADGDSGDNEEYRYNHPIYDDATPKRFINSWQQDGAAADNLQDIIGANLVASYGDNSQIWSGVIGGDINISNAITDPLNFDRTFQLQKIVRNLETNFNTISMIEIAPNKSYVVEQIGDNGAGSTYYFLSKTYGDISALFTGAVSYNISVIRNKATSAILDNGGDRTPDGASSFVSGRVRILVSDGEYTGADVECKGILRIL